MGVAGAGAQCKRAQSPADHPSATTVGFLLSMTSTCMSRKSVKAENDSEVPTGLGQAEFVTIGVPRCRFDEG